MSSNQKGAAVIEYVMLFCTCALALVGFVPSTTSTIVAKLARAEAALSTPLPGGVNLSINPTPAPLTAVDGGGTDGTLTTCDGPLQTWDPELGRCVDN